MAPGTSARLNTIIQTTIKETWLIIEWYFGLKVDHYTVLRIYRDRSRHWKGDQNSVLQLQQSWTSMCVVLQWLRMQSIRFLGIWGNAPQEILKNNCEFGAIWVFNYCGALSIRLPVKIGQQYLPSSDVMQEYIPWVMPQNVMVDCISFPEKWWLILTIMS